MESKEMTIYEVLFICDGNVGRSQMAEGFYHNLKKPKLAISAGINDVANKYGGHPTQEIIDVMLEIGIDVSQNEIKLLTIEMIQKSKHVVVMCDKKHCPDILLTGNNKIIFKRIKDPYQMDTYGTRQVRDQVKQLVMKLSF